MNKTTDGKNYCPRCDTVWASPEKCRCSPTDRLAQEVNDKRYIDGWNAAIEAAADIADGQLIKHVGHKIRKLKK